MSSKLNKLIDDIRTCRDCEISPRNTPCVYTSNSSDILVIEEMTSWNAWEADTGQDWRLSLSVSGEGNDTPSVLARWLGMNPINAEKRLFWLQRANCYTNLGKNHVFQHCSCKFIPLTIDTVRPRLIIALGRIAAEWFFQFEKLQDIVGKRTKHTQDGVDYPCLVFFHPSSARWWKEHEEQHENAIRLVKMLLKE